MPTDYIGQRMANRFRNGLSTGLASDPFKLAWLAFFLTGLAGIFHNCSYISNRINDDKWLCVNRHFVNAFCVLLENSREKRKQIVQDIISFQKPICNQNVADASTELPCA